MTDQTKAPERIFTTACGESVVTNLVRHPSDVEYVRANLVAEQVRGAYERAAQIAEYHRGICGLDQHGYPYVGEEVHIFSVSVADDICCEIRALKSDDTNGGKP